MESEITATFDVASEWNMGLVLYIMCGPFFFALHEIKTGRDKDYIDKRGSQKFRAYFIKKCRWH